MRDAADPKAAAQHIARRAAQELWNYCAMHLPRDRDEQALYRILIYDCAPLSERKTNPISGQFVYLSKTPQFLFRTALQR